MAKKDLVVNISSKTKGLEQGMSKSVNEVRKLENQTRKSKNEFKQFDDRIGKLASGNLSGLLGTMGNVAGILGVAKLAQEGFTRSMRATQTTSDAFDVVMGQVNTSVDYFFTALSTGNFENFFSGMASAIQYSKDLTEALDSLADMKLADKFFKAEENYKLSKNRAIINAPDGDYTKEERLAALKENETIIEKMTKRADVIAEKSQEARINAYKKFIVSTPTSKHNAQYGARRGMTLDEVERQWYREMLDEIMDETLAEIQKIQDSTKSKEEKDRIINSLWGTKHIDEYYADDSEEFRNTLADYIASWDIDKEMEVLFNKVYSGVDTGYLEFEKKMKELELKIQKTTQKTVKGGKEEMSKQGIAQANWEVLGTEDNPSPSTELENLIKNNNAYKQLYDIKNVIGDDGIEKLVRLNEEEFNALTAIENLKNTQNRLAKRLEDNRKGGGDKDKPQEGSIGYIDEQIKDLNKEFKLAINEEDRKRIKTQLEELEAEKAKLELKVEVTIPEGSLSAINEKISELNKELSLEVDEDSRIEIWKQIKELEEKKIKIEVGYKQEVVPTPIEGVRDTMFDYNKTTADKLYESLQLKNSYISELRKETELFADELERAEREANSLEKQLNFQYVKDDLESFNKALTDSYMDAYSQTMNIASAFTNLANSVQSLNEDDTTSQWEKLLNVFSAVGNAIQSLVSTIELYNRVEDIITSITAAKQVEMALDGTKAASEIADITALTTAKVTAQSTETAAVVTSNTAITASLTPLISAATTLMAAESTAAYAMIPFAGVGLAASQITSMEGLIAMASIPKFAEGGLVYGNTIAQVGEYAGASTNPEVIAPLSKLRDILADTQQGGGIGGVVDFRIAGKDLVGVFNNYSSKQSKK